MSLKNKYKEKNPKDTIENIKNFFNNKNLIIKERDLIQSEESGIWSCYIELYSEENKFFQTCGKGTTKEFALASGYGEMYERFCNKNYLFSQLFSYNFLLQENKKQNNYYIHPKEKELNIENIKNKKIYHDFLSLFGNEMNTDNFLNLFCNDKIIEIPFLNCFNKDDMIYEDPRLWQKINGSSGMAAGNTLEEALVQGISEIFEHYAQEQFFKNPPQKLYEINRKYIDFNNLILIKEIEKNDKKIKIFDLSYNYNIPACLGILFNKKTYNYLINFSAAPTINIAIERVLTEIYQNKNDYNTVNMLPQSPFYTTSWENILVQGYTRISLTNSFYEKILLNIKKVKPNNIFLKEDLYTNKDFLNYYEKIINNINLKLYYCDRSQDEKIYSIQIINLGKDYRTFYKQFLNNVSTERKKEILDICINLYKLIYDSLLNNYNNLIFYMNSISKISYLEKEEKEYAMYILGTNWFNPFFKRENLFAFFSLCSKNFNLNLILSKIQNTDFEFYARKYLSLFQYKMSQKYSNEEIYYFFSKLDDTLTLKDIELCNKHDFLFYKIILEPMKNMYISSTFINMINAYCD